MMVGERTRRKAERLIAENRITVLHRWEGPVASPGGAFVVPVGIVAIVRGDSGTYLTTVIRPEWMRDARAGAIGAPAGSCTCEAGRVGEHLCSHEAALTILLVDR